MRWLDFLRRSRGAALWCGVLPWLAVIAGAILLAVSHRDTNAAFAEVERTHQVKKHVHAVCAALSRAESANRGYVLTADKDFLIRFETSLAEITNSLAQLRPLVRDARAGELLAQFAPSAERKIDFMLELVRRPIPSSSDTQVVMLVERGASLMEDAEVSAAALLEREQGLLATRQRYAASRMSAHSLLMWTCIGVSALGVGAFVLVAHRAARLYAVVKMCSQSRELEIDGNWMSIEQFLEQRYGVKTTHGLSPNEVERFQEELRKLRAQHPKPSPTAA